MYIINEWIRFLSYPEEKRQPPWDFELVCRVHLIGEINIGWGTFQFWEVPLKRDRSAIRSVVLRMHFRGGDYQEYQDIPDKKDQYYHPHGTAGEFECLISLFTRAHFVLTKGTFAGDTPMFRRFSDKENVAHSDVDGSDIDLRNIQQYFDMMRMIREVEIQNIDSDRRYVKKFIMAARFYHLALPLIEQDETLAYICLVSSIECMLKGYRTGEFGLQDVNPEAHKLLNEAISNAVEREAIERAILKYEPKIGWRFAMFIKDHLSDAFWNETTRPPVGPFRFRDSGEVSEYVRRIYAARSAAVHRGEPFPKSFGNEERNPSHSMQIGHKKWTHKELLPSVSAFERLVHHVLLESLIRQYRTVVT